jgi:hypothetical protein
MWKAERGSITVSKALAGDISAYTPWNNLFEKTQAVGLPVRTEEPFFACGIKLYIVHTYLPSYLFTVRYCTYLCILGSCGRLSLLFTNVMLTYFRYLILMHTTRLTRIVEVVVLQYVGVYG